MPHSSDIKLNQGIKLTSGPLTQPIQLRNWLGNSIWIYYLQQILNGSLSAFGRLVCKEQICQVNQLLSSLQIKQLQRAWCLRNASQDAHKCRRECKDWLLHARKLNINTGIILNSYKSIIFSQARNDQESWLRLSSLENRLTKQITSFGLSAKWHRELPDESILKLAGTSGRRKTRLTTNMSNNHTKQPESQQS